jgi:hypothetical protein
MEGDVWTTILVAWITGSIGFLLGCWWVARPPLDERCQFCQERAAELKRGE